MPGRHLHVTFGANPFIGIENVGTGTQPDIRLWYDNEMPEDHMRAILAAMDAWSEHLHYVLDSLPSPLPRLVDPTPPGAADENPRPIPPEHVQFAP